MNIFESMGYHSKIHMPTPKSLEKATARLIESNTYTTPQEFKVLITIPAAAVNKALSKGKDIEVLLLYHRTVVDGVAKIKTLNITKDANACIYWQSLIGDFSDYINAYLEGLYRSAISYLQKRNLSKVRTHLLHYSKDAVLKPQVV